MPPSSPARPCTSRSASSTWRPWPAAPPESRPGSAGYPRLSLTARPACLCRPPTRPRWPARQIRSSPTRPGRSGWENSAGSGRRPSSAGPRSPRRRLRSTRRSSATVKIHLNYRGGYPMQSQEPDDRAAAEAERQPGGTQPVTPPYRVAAAGPPPGPAIRASDRDRDSAAHRVQEAFADGRLDDEEFDGRMRAVLTARTIGELDRLTEDVPAPAARGGRWRVPERFQAVVYKGNGLLDLRAAELIAPVTTVAAIAYKSRIDILVP